MPAMRFPWRRRMNPEPEDGTGLTYRCSICSENWPLFARFAECPVCEHRTSFMRIELDAILTIPQANEILRDHGLPTIQTKRRIPVMGPGDAAARQPKTNAVAVGREPTEDEVKRLHKALDDWALFRPSWMRRHG